VEIPVAMTVRLAAIRIVEIHLTAYFAVGINDIRFQIGQQVSVLARQRGQVVEYIARTRAVKRKHRPHTV
jgi:hypothetical protein